MLARVIVCDPPWTFGDQLPGGGRGAEKHYKCMSLSEIIRMPLPPIADSAVLFMWRVSSMVEEAYSVVRAWDFVPKSEVVWNKTNADGSLALGMGRIVRGSHETCIVAARGKPIETMSKKERTSFLAPRGQHSEKPEEFYRLVERLYPLELWPEAHVELFARRRRKGWIQFGDELPPEAANGVSDAAPQKFCVLHGPVRGDSCGPCSIIAASVTLKRLLAREGWRGAGWRGARQLTSRDEIEAAKAPPPAQSENLSALSTRLQVRAIEVPLPELMQMTPTQRDVARAYVEQGGDIPEFLQPYVRGAARP